MKIMTYDHWLKGIGGRASLGEDTHLKNIDDALRAHSKGSGRLAAGTRESLAKLETALDAWHRAYTRKPGYYGALANWQTAGFMVTDLYQQVKGPNKLPHDALPETLEKDTQEARLGVLHLFSEVRVSGKFATDIATTLLSGVRFPLTTAGKVKDVEAPFLAAGITKGTARYVQDRVTDFTVVKPATTAEKIGFAVWESAVAAKNPSAGATPIAHGTDVRQIVLDFVKRVWAAVTDFIRTAVGTAWAQCKEFVSQFVEQPLLIAQEIADVFIRQVLPSIAPFYGAAKTLSKSLRGLLDTAVQPFVDRLKFGHVGISQGFAQSVVSGIRFGSGWMAGNHVYAAIQSIANVVLMAAASPAAPLVGFVMSIAANIATLCYRSWERSMLRAFCKEARQHFIAGEYSKDNRNGNARALTNDRDAFDRWFKPYARWVPSISSLMLTSHICGSAYVYVNMLRPNGELIDSKSFIKGVDYLSALTSQGKRYLRQSGLVISSRSEQGKVYL